MKYLSVTFLEYSDAFKEYFNCGVCDTNLAIGDIFDTNMSKVPVCKQCLEKIISEEQLERE